MYTYFWEYRVNQENDDKFREHYGLEGSWVKLFRRAEGYVKTELFRDLEDKSRYITLDQWESKEAFDEFLRVFATDYQALDRQCEVLTLEEGPVGGFENI